VVALFVGRQPVVHDAVAQRQSGGLVPIVAIGLACFLADRESQFGEDRALDLDQRQFVDRLIERGKGGRERWIWQCAPRDVRLTPNDTRLARTSKPAPGSVAARLHGFYAITGPIRHRPTTGL